MRKGIFLWMFFPTSLIHQTTPAYPHGCEPDKGKHTLVHQSIEIDTTGGKNTKIITIYLWFSGNKILDKSYNIKYLVSFVLFMGIFQVKYIIIQI